MKINRSKDSKILIYSDINSFLAKRGLDNKDDIAYIWRIKYEMFNDIRGWSFKDAKPYMLAIKKLTKVTSLQAYKLNVLSFRDLIKYLYLIFPSVDACIYYRTLNEIIKVLYHMTH